ELLVRVGEVVDEDFLRQREGPPELGAAGGQAVGETGVDALDEFDRGGGTDSGHVDNYNTSLCHTETCGRPVTRRSPRRCASARSARLQDRCSRPKPTCRPSSVRAVSPSGGRSSWCVTLA